WKGAEASIPLCQSEEGSHRRKTQAITLERSKHEAQSRLGTSLLLASLPEKLTKIPLHESEGWKVLSRESRRLGANLSGKIAEGPLTNSRRMKGKGGKSCRAKAEG